MTNGVWVSVWGGFVLVNAAVAASLLAQARAADGWTALGLLLLGFANATAGVRSARCLWVSWWWWRGE